jgi:hypothetical protein
MESWQWVLFGLGGVTVLGVLWDAWRYWRATRAVMGLLKKRGPMDGLELVQQGIPRSHVYLILNRLEQDGLVDSFLSPTPAYRGQKKYKVRHEPRS